MNESYTTQSTGRPVPARSSNRPVRVSRPTHSNRAWYSSELFASARPPESKPSEISRAEMGPKEGPFVDFVRRNLVRAMVTRMPLWVNRFANWSMGFTWPWVGYGMIKQWALFFPLSSSMVVSAYGTI
ncbi:double-stranded-RNA-binding protein 4 [Striga asiatica]|uniref:Double-stranded-RNA-binding protein 4 n=1 Tax=Striga asiatica TaxID=4170 RepID=A0A5A7P559_STRAF|nr:double-stranded-RNA-binding protein 4 [Striga asiatica]